MEKISIKEYAVKHKLSIFNVIKMVKYGKLKSVVEDNRGKNETYILLDNKIEKEVKKSIMPVSESRNIGIKEELEQLRVEIRILKYDIDILKKAIL